MLTKNLTTVAFAGLLSACSGGGGSSGTCNGSVETCTGQRDLSASSSSAASIGNAGSMTGGEISSGASGTESNGFPVLVTNQQILERITCSDIMALNGSDRHRQWLAIQEAYMRGATYLDGVPQNGIPCDSHGFPP